MSSDKPTFADLGVADSIVAALTDADIHHPFPIQELSLPMALTGADLIGQARTGTGKTLAFGIPLVQRVAPDGGFVQALVVVPTRELCLQVHDDLVLAGSKRGVQVVAAYGGRAIDPQSEAIAAGAPIVVGTPGRLLDLCRRGLLDLSRVSMVVLDEADEMLDMGFLPDVEQLVERTATPRQTLLFSATVPSAIVKLARRYMDKPTFMRSDVEQQTVAPETKQHFFACHRMDKPAVVARILSSPARGRTLIFTRTKRMADVLAADLRERGIDAGVIHSDLRQEARERALTRFRDGTQDVLCATEVAARGLDIDQLTHVINYDCPDDERMYLHRIGRTGRAGAAGIAITLAVWNELARMEMIKKALSIDEPTLEVFSTSPVLDELFGPVEAPPTQRNQPRPAASRRTTAAPADATRGTTPRRSRRRRRRPHDDADPSTPSAVTTTKTARPTPDEPTSRAAAGNETPKPNDGTAIRDTRDGDSSTSATPGRDTRATETTETAAEDGGAKDSDATETANAGGGKRRRSRGRRRRTRTTADSTRSDVASGDDEPAASTASQPGREEEASVADQPAETAQDHIGSDAPSLDATTADDQPERLSSAGDGSSREGSDLDDDGGGRRGREDRARRSDRDGRRKTQTPNGSGRDNGGPDRNGDARRREPGEAPASPQGRSARGDGRPTLQRPLKISFLP